MMWLKVAIFQHVLTITLLLKSQTCEEVSERGLFLAVFHAIVMTGLAVKVDPHVVKY